MVGVLTVGSGAPGAPEPLVATVPLGTDVSVEAGDPAGARHRNRVGAERARIERGGLVVSKLGCWQVAPVSGYTQRFCRSAVMNCWTRSSLAESTLSWCAHACNEIGESSPG